MSESKQHGSFSFQLSETPPPAEAHESSPLGDLDLDLGEFDQSEPVASEPVALEVGASVPEAAAIEVVPGEGAGDFAFDLTPVGSPELGSVELPEQIPLPEVPSIEVLEANANLEFPKKFDEASSPKIKKIQFPTSQKSPPAKTTPVKLNPESLETREGSQKPKTHFSKSIAPPAARAEFDSEPEKDPEPESPSRLSFPEDLPESEEGGLQVASEMESEGPSWSSDTPNARDIWKQARKTWGVTSRQALAIGGHGLRAGQKLARDANQKMRERLQETGREDAGLSEEESPEDRLADRKSLAAGPTHSETSSTPAPRSSGSTTGRVILALARSTGKKLAAPLSAAAAAALVYFGGTQLLGATGGFALSKVASGPDIPALGSLDGGKDGAKEGAEKVEATSQKRGLESGSVGENTEKKPASGPSPMKVESTEMPQGLSWPGKGLIEVVTSEDELIYVDGVFTGRGPLRRVPVSPGDHEVSIRTGGVKRTGTVQVRAGRNTRAVFSLD